MFHLAVKEIYNLVDTYSFVFRMCCKVLFIAGAQQVSVNNASDKDGDGAIRLYFQYVAHLKKN